MDQKWTNNGPKKTKNGPQMKYTNTQIHKYKNGPTMDQQCTNNRPKNTNKTLKHYQKPKLD